MAKPWKITQDAKDAFLFQNIWLYLGLSKNTKLYLSTVLYESSLLINTMWMYLAKDICHNYVLIYQFVSPCMRLIWRPPPKHKEWHMQFAAIKLIGHKVWFSLQWPNWYLLFFEFQSTLVLVNLISSKRDTHSEFPQGRKLPDRIQTPSKVSNSLQHFHHCHLDSQIP